jgi:hypothetical protein
MLTGELPYPKLTSKETLVRRLTSPPRTLAEVRPDVAWPRALQDVLNRALTPEVKDRYENVGEFGRAVVRAVEESEPIAAAPAAAVAASELPITRPAPNANVEDGTAVGAQLPRRRVMPYVVATLVAVSAGVLILTTRAHRTAAIPDDDSLAVTAAVPAPTIVTVTPPPALAPPSRPNATGSAPRGPTAPQLSPQAQAQAQAQARARASAMSDFGQRLSDSLQRVIGQIPLAELTRVDSVLARIGPEIERARRAEASGAARLPQRHYWLAPSGDSVDAEPLPPDAPLEARTNVAAQEIRGHIARMQQRFMNHDLPGARREYSSASTELQILRDFDPDLRRTADLQRELALGMRDLLVMCYRMRADSTLSPGVHCENFFGTPGRFREFRQPN